MFLQLAHTKLDIYGFVKTFVHQCYILSNQLPTEERFNMISQLRRAALSVLLNNAEGCSRKSATERKRFFEIARGSIIEIDAIIDIATEMNYIEEKDVDELGKSMLLEFKLLSGLINNIKN